MTNRQSFGLSFTIPILSIVCGLSVPLLSIYQPQNYIGWALMTLGFGVLSLLGEGSTRAQYMGCQVPLGMGLGIVWLSTQFAILAPLPVSNNAHAIAFYTFTRCFIQSWGVVIGGTILQNTILRDLPPSFLETIPQGVQIAYAAIPALESLIDPVKTDVRVAFARSVRLIWLVMIGVGGTGLLSCTLMREIPMRTDMDETWAVTDSERAQADVKCGVDVGSTVVAGLVAI
ncbi:hypothetical protein L226DRAFT_522272 [Lentinus tigrinus ALCF2SS1-7]|uniref:MFS general substrate transporter n=1 Tax=Lentinus tigrinus ALCF2SS1-6 TaxID=1328759 RepID=A0A5C2SBJ6_9APHY|nr:hypothetical protein L227DRAFT_563398 [Lentinus tigrinus ALCF2SS1-6]RPD75766.1 hypothetical protein L226DRAFT_522272 [Lentinus tigrinus ALCF2SS1-7]